MCKVCGCRANERIFQQNGNISVDYCPKIALHFTKIGVHIFHFGKWSGQPQPSQNNNNAQQCTTPRISCVSIDSCKTEWAVSRWVDGWFAFRVDPECSCVNWVRYSSRAKNNKQAKRTKALQWARTIVCIRMFGDLETRRRKMKEWVGIAGRECGWLLEQHNIVASSSKDLWSLSSECVLLFTNFHSTITAQLLIAFH